jgi:benzoyl-CoA reductase/2-hydroxyglutaryl-CoA dehydratase subunit BcrC/BadD/HgdB
MNSIAYTSPFIPVEWIAAHGLRPAWLRLRSAATRPMLAATRGVCPYAGALVDAATAGIDAAGLVLTTICDQMRYAAALAEGGQCPVFLMNVPSTWQTAESRALYREELRRLGRFLEQLGGIAPRSVKLVEVMEAYQRARCVALGQSEACAAGESAKELLMVRDALVVPISGGVGPECRLKPGLRTDGIPLAVVGGPLLDGDFDFFDILEDAGGRVVLDATENGERTLPRKFDPARMAADPFEELAASYFDVIPDAFRQPNTALYDWLGRELAARRVRGIVFRRYVWCDLWHAELQRLKQWSPVPVLEIDAGADDESASARIRSRVEAFLEMLA